jgi:hypothetical protein
MKSMPLMNPADKYPKPPFRRQSQPWPGLADLDTGSWGATFFPDSKEEANVRSHIFW